MSWSASDGHWTSGYAAAPARRGGHGGSRGRRIVVAVVAVGLVCWLAFGGLAWAWTTLTGQGPQRAGRFEHADVSAVIATTRDALDAYWSHQFASHSRQASYVAPTVSTFTSADATVQSACGPKRTKHVDGFYCSADLHIYIESDVASYQYLILVMAHEWGHHVRYLLDRNANRAYRANPVPQELQAACAEGLWGFVEVRTGDLTDDEVHSYADAWLQSEGDATHGTGRQIGGAILQGYRGGTPASCGFAVGLSTQDVPRLGAAAH